MRLKKAVKQLSKAGSLISAVASRYTPSDPQFQELLKSATATLEEAKTALDSDSRQSEPKSSPATKKQNRPQAPETAEVPKFSGSKTDFIRAVVDAGGTSGVTPKDVDEAFTARRIPKSKNLIYNALSILVKQKKLTKRDGRYLPVSAGSNIDSAAPKKRISPEGLKRIVEANKKRWAAKRAGNASAGQKTAAAKKSAGGRKTVAR